MITVNMDCHFLSQLLVQLLLLFMFVLVDNKGFASCQTQRSADTNSNRQLDILFTCLVHVGNFFILFSIVYIDSSDLVI